MKDGCACLKHSHLNVGFTIISGIGRKSSVAEEGLDPGETVQRLAYVKKGETYRSL